MKVKKYGMRGAAHTDVILSLSEEMLGCGANKPLHLEERGTVRCRQIGKRLKEKEKKGK